MAQRVLVVDDQEGSRKGLNQLLTTWGYEVQEAADGSEAFEKATAFKPAVVISDLVMPGMDGLELLKTLQQDLPFTVTIILTGQGTVETAVSAMKEGAYDYLTKPVDVTRLKILVQKAWEKGEALREVTLLRRRVQEMWGLGQLVGKSHAMQEVYRLIDHASQTTAPVLILGESGTGKELAARSLHQLSPRRDGPFVAVNCSAIPENLLESEIFGHEKGAFTGAVERRAGCFELAHGGTIFLDEVAEMAPSTQVKFLRIIQDGMVRRVGGKNEMKVDVRILAATNKDPLQAMKDGMLREDLYYRLNVFSVTLPPLRSRREDIPLLVEAFIQEFNSKYEKRLRSVDEETLRILTSHSWPGNVRELRNTLERASILCGGDLIGPGDLPKLTTSVDAQSPREDQGLDAITILVGSSVEEAEKKLILRTLASVNNNKTKAAEILGISLKTLHNRLHQYHATE